MRDGHAPAIILQGSRKFLHHRSLARPADREIADGDNETTRAALAKEPIAVKPEADLDDLAKQTAQCEEEPTQQKRAFPYRRSSNDVDRKLFEVFKPAPEHRFK